MIIVGANAMDSRGVADDTAENNNGLYWWSG